MRKILFMLVMICSVSVFADTSSSGSSSSTASTTATGGAVISQNYAGTDLSNAVPNVSAPGLSTTLTETCMGSSSGGVAGAGFGFSFGTTWRDTACVRRLDSRQIGAYGQYAIAFEMMCDSQLVREAAVRAGRPCVADGGKPLGTPVLPADQIVQVPSEVGAAPTVSQQVNK
jgi:hypothetical protein